MYALDTSRVLLPKKGEIEEEERGGKEGESITNPLILSLFYHRSV